MAEFDLPGICETARKAARVGGQVLSSHYRVGYSEDRQGEQAVESRGKVVEQTQGSDAKELASYNLVTDADLESERKIAEVIHGAFPDHAIMAEETYRADASAEHLWIVDPLDGTNNFAHGIPHFAVSIAYYFRGEPQLGIVFNPIRDDWFEAIKGQGATYNGKRVQVSSTNSLQESIIAVGFYYDRGEMMDSTLNAVGDLFRAHIHGIRRMGTAALDLCQVGLGWYGGYFEFQLCPWDFAAGQLFVEEAGGRVTTCEGLPLKIEMSSILATNSGIHDAVQKVIQPYFKPEFCR